MYLLALFFVGNEKGGITLYDLRKKELSNFSEMVHKFQIHDMQMSADQNFLITASKDKTARLFDARSLECLKVYKLAHLY